MSPPMASVEKIQETQHARGLASILAIGTANPANCINQVDYPDFFFRVTKSEHMTQLKEKFKHICEKAMIKKRHLHLTEEILNENPNIYASNAPSLDARQDILVAEVPKLGKEAALKAIKEWGKPKSEITHLIFCTVSGIDMPGADYHLTKLLSLSPSIKRVMLYHQGCYIGGTALRMAKDFAENNVGARVLLVCSEINIGTFRGLSDATDMDGIIGQAILGDGAIALIIGTDSDVSIERPIFHIVSAAQTIIPESDGAIIGHIREIGYLGHLSKNVPKLICDSIEKCLVEAFSPIGISDWNSLFWMVHPGGPSILNKIEAKLGLEEEKLRATRNVLSEYGNMASASVLFVLEEMRNKSMEEGKATTGEGLEWGVLFGFGAGLTVDTVVLRSVPVVGDY